HGAAKTSLSLSISLLDSLCSRHGGSNRKPPPPPPSNPATAAAMTNSDASIEPPYRRFLPAKRRHLEEARR
ncbi:hypothetical protein LINGRAHAP2_LOCUS10852, partial [Linum grandiflorum]